ncbi:MAG: hypothetical protein RLZZ461_1109 [Planctomycetota bacterium]
MFRGDQRRGDASLLDIDRRGFRIRDPTRHPHPDDNPRIVTSKTTDPASTARTWRARAAQAAVADLGRTGDRDALESAQRVVDRGLLGAGLAFATLAGLGTIAGWTATAELLRPVEAPVHAPAMLLALVVTPWLLLLVRTIVLLAVRRRAMPLLGRLVPIGFSHAVGRWRPAGTEPSIVTAAARSVGQVLANGSGRRVAAAGTGVFWTAFAATAIVTLWLLTARVALGFGWESSWLPPRVGQAITDLAAAPLAPLIGTEELQPVAPPPTAAADDETALQSRRRWIRFLSAGLVVYLLIPMFVWTFANAAIGHWLAERWRPPARPTSVTTRNAGPNPAAEGVAGVGDARASTATAGQAATHLVSLERPSVESTMPAALARLTDLGDLDSAEAIARVVDATPSGDAVIVVVAWLPATPDRGVRRRLHELAARTAHPPRLVLDGGDRLRRSEPPATVALRLADWRGVARDLDLTAIEVDIEHLTSESERSLMAFLDGARGNADDRGSTGVVALDPSRLDAAFAAIGRHLDDGHEALPSDAGYEAAVRAVVAEFDGDAVARDRLQTWTSRLSGTALATWRRLDDERPAARLAALARGGLDLLPDGVRSGAVWASLGGLLGASACIAAATVTPAALVGLPGWIGSGAGLGGLLSLTRLPGGGEAGAANDAEATETAKPARLDDRVPALATLAVLWWSQGGDEARTSRLLNSVLPGDSLPALADADAARRWLASVRTRVVAAAEGVA